MRDELAVAGPATWTLSARQLDHLWERLGFDVFPFPFEVIRQGATDLERARLGTVVLDELRAQRLLDRSLRLDTDLEAALRQLANPERSVDSVWLPGDDPPAPHRVLAALSGRRAVLGTQAPDGSGGALTLRDIDPADLAGPVLDTLPGRRPGRWPGGIWPLATARQDRELAMRLGGRHLASGQIGATVRDDSGHRHRGAVLHWFDLAGDGRYALLRSTDRIEVRPATTAALRDRIAGLFSGLDNAIATQPQP